MNFFLIAPFADHCLLVPFYRSAHDTTQAAVINKIQLLRGARWRSGRASDSESKGPWFDSHRRHRVMSLCKTHKPLLVKLKKRWLCLDMTEKLLTGTLSLNTNKHIQLLDSLEAVKHSKRDGGVQLVFFFCSGFWRPGMSIVGQLTGSVSPRFLFIMVVIMIYLFVLDVS